MKYPDRPGVYIFKSKSNRPIYVGKAKSLKKRLASYFKKTNDDPKVALILKSYHSLDYIITKSELEALILESILIKKHHPRYNIILRDDKNYPYLKLTMNEEWPRLLKVRKILNDKAMYFGPFESRAVKEILGQIKRIFPIIWCKKFKVRQQPCLQFYIKRCAGPCVNRISHQDYLNLCLAVASYLKGDLVETIDRLRQEMTRASSEQRYEQAAKLRDRLRNLERLSHKQDVLLKDKKDRDVVALSRDFKRVCILIFQIRGGKLVNKETYFPSVYKDDPGQILMSAMIQYYSSASYIPGEIILAEEVENKPLLQKYIQSVRGKKVSIKIKKTGIAKMALENAELLLSREEMRWGEEATSVLKVELGLKQLPRRIEAFDVSNIQGSSIVAAMAVFENGASKKSDYRRFKIRTAGEAPNDVAAIYEAVFRRYARTLKSKLPRPRLVLIDGGIAQVRSGKSALLAAGLKAIPVIGLAKREEEIYFPDKNVPIRLERSSPGLKLLQRIRDEAHRFAVSYHRLKRGEDLKPRLSL